jgi:arylsulfatase A-like enzyme
MMHNSFSGFAMMSYLKGLAVVCALAANCLAESPNVIVILSDDMGYSDVERFGKTEISTPGLNRLAEEGVRFTNAYVTAPICTASRMGLLSGRYQQRFGVYCNFHDAHQNHLAMKATLLPAVFQKAGYRTALVGKWHLSGNSTKRFVLPGPLTRGFDEFVGIPGGGSGFFKGALILRQEAEEKSPEYMTDFFGNEACAFIDRNHKHPFFLYLAFNAVHSPMHATQDDIAAFPRVKDRNRRIYCGMLRAMDRNIGRVLNQLDKHNLADNTIVVFLNDNGGGGSTPDYAGHSRNYANNLPLRGHKFDVYEGGIRVPMVMRWPRRFNKSHVYEKMVSSMDVYPTVVAAAGLTMLGEECDGVNLLPHLSGKKHDDPHEWLCWQNRAWFPQKPGDFGRPASRVHNSAIRRGKWKLVRLQENIDEPDPPSWQLYDLDADIGEANDVSAKHAEIVKELSARFNKWRSSMHPCISAGK